MLSLEMLIYFKTKTPLRFFACPLGRSLSRPYGTPSGAVKIEMTENELSKRFLDTTLVYL